MIYHFRRYLTEEIHKSLRPYFLLVYRQWFICGKQVLIFVLFYMLV